MFEVVKGAKLVAANSISNSETASHVNLSPPNNGTEIPLEATFLKEETAYVSVEIHAWLSLAKKKSGELCDIHTCNREIMIQ